ncbi:MAG: EutN/CcmL family microcompartment protein [Acidimicrobiia bacterium]|nr:EutN/CcmL family microcompartment protein [Acidimicrobiia bacterium]NNF89296.1 EutN/CcmL family microcompartment protein [Acidimicrobiia bacterium]NNJ47613.1 EutN/CcmL family microcompartment protein [Acidimicrobiia bacterium]NNL13038.1 EutN/CcmL family microcompartment protein [Acidimicrobiia bacterium]NNL70154.1 EutN/CcmL family microcompartment protein [Acidimicrobiia bacterium]
MKIGRVAGTVVSTISASIFDGRKLLLCDIVSPGGEPTGDYTIAADTIDAGVGDTVLILDEGSSARHILGKTVAPIRALVVGIVDEIDVEQP